MCTSKPPAHLDGAGSENTTSSDSFNNSLFYLPNSMTADRCGHAVWGVGLRLLACWKQTFESRQWHGCLYLLSVVCCHVEVSASGWSLVQRSPTDCSASLCVITKPRKQGGHRPHWAAEPEKTINSNNERCCSSYTPKTHLYRDRFILFLRGASYATGFYVSLLT
jgi:hypothetical protein